MAKCPHETTAEVETITTATGRERHALQCQNCGAIIRDEDGGPA